MRHETRNMTTTTGVATLTAPGTLSGGAGLNRYVDKTIQVSITGEALAQIDGTIDGTTWCKLGSDIAASTMRYVPESVTSLRVVVTSVTGEASVAAIFGGFDPRTGD